jgi:hypothetical protein
LNAIAFRFRGGKEINNTFYKSTDLIKILKFVKSKLNKI